MVAYGSPNKYHRRSHRGRKRCGMQFGTTAVRLLLGLNSKPSFDPDVRAGRLVNADPYLASVLYGSQIAPPTAVEPPQVAGVEPKDEGDGDIIEGFVEIGKEKPTAYSIAGNEYASATTIYFLTDGRVRRGDELLKQDKNLMDHLPEKTRILVGYVYGGNITNNRVPVSVVGREWNYPSTFYRLPDGRIVSGDNVNPRAIPRGTIVLFRR